MNTELKEIVRRAESGKYPIFPSETAQIAQYIDSNGSIPVRSGKIINGRQLRLHFLDLMDFCVPEIANQDSKVGDGIDHTIANMVRLQKLEPYMSDPKDIKMKFFNEELTVDYYLTTLRKKHLSDLVDLSVEKITEVMALFNKRENCIDDVFYMNNADDTFKCLDAHGVDTLITTGNPQN